MGDAATLLGLKNKIIKLSPDVRSKMTTLLTGASGTGKSHQIRSLVQGGMRVLVVSSEKKLPTLQDLDIDVWPVDTYDFPRFASEKATVKSDMMEVLDFIRKSEHSYDVLAVDSGMRFLDKMAQLILGEPKGDMRQAYGLFAKKAVKWLEVLCECADVSQSRPVHVVVTWGVEISEDWQGRRKISPIVDGQKASPRIPYYFDNVFYMKKQEQDGNKPPLYQMVTGGTNEVDAKYSSAVVQLPAVIDMGGESLYKVLCKLEGK